MCECLQEYRSFESALNAGHAVAVHYHINPQAIVVFIECEHQNVIPFTAMDGTREFHALYDVLWKAKIDCAEES